jgi:uncharacterized protein
MRTVFADAAYWIALLNPRDSLHAASVRVSDSLAQTRIVTSEMVLIEVLNALAKYRELRPQVVTVVAAIQADPNTDVVPLSGIQFRDALRFYATHADKEWGLTDCASFVLMRERGIGEALTYDRDFEQAGFIALLR